MYLNVRMQYIQRTSLRLLATGRNATRAQIIRLLNSSLSGRLLSTIVHLQFLVRRHQIIVQRIDQHIPIVVQTKVQLLQHRQHIDNRLDAIPVQARVVQHQIANASQTAAVAQLHRRRPFDWAAQPIQAEIDELDARHVRENGEHLVPVLQLVLGEIELLDGAAFLGQIVRFAGLIDVAVVQHEQLGNAAGNNILYIEDKGSFKSFTIYLKKIGSYISLGGNFGTNIETSDSC